MTPTAVTSPLTHPPIDDRVNSQEILVSSPATGDPIAPQRVGEMKTATYSTFEKKITTNKLKL